MKCFMFPGQPLSPRQKLPDDPDFAEVSGLVRQTAHLDLESFEWLKGEGSENVKLQLLGVAESLYMLRKLRRHGIEPDIAAQHSMGIYPALVACGSIGEAEAVEITWRVGSAISRMKSGGYALGCVIGLTLHPILDVALNNSVYLANLNTSRHFLLCGKKEAIDLAVAEAAEAGAFSVRTFGCDAPLHTPLMAPLDQELFAIFKEYRYRDPQCPLLDHLDQHYLHGFEIPRFMLRELSLPVYWEQTYRTLRRAGAKEFRELGSGDSLTKYNRWIEGEIAK